MSIIDKFQPMGGKHSVTCSIRQVLNYYGIRISEEMLFGLASAYQFSYFDYRNLDFPMISGRIKPKVFEENLAKHSFVGLDYHKTSSQQKAWKDLVQQIEQQDPVILYADKAELPYLHYPEGQHNGNHTVVVFGLDDSNEQVYLSDRDQKGYPITYSPEEEPQDFHILSYEQLQRARSSKFKPFPPENAWITMNLEQYQIPHRKQIFTAIRENMYHFLNPPIENLGIKGILFFAKALVEWENWSAEKTRWAAFNAFVMIDQIGGTGGGIFRKMYGQFLLESAMLAAAPALGAIGEQYLIIGEQWDEVSRKFYSLFQGEEPGILKDIATRLQQLANFEEGLANQLMTVIGSAYS